MVKYFMLLLCAIYTVHAGNGMSGCLRKTAEGAETFVKEEVANGDAQIVGEFLAAKAVDKYLATQDPKKLEKYGVSVTATADGGHEFEAFGQKVATLQPAQDKRALVEKLAPHVLASLKTAAQSASSGSSQVSSPDQQ